MNQGRILEDDEDFYVGGLAPSFMPESGYEYIAGVSGWPRPITPGLLSKPTVPTTGQQPPPKSPVTGQTSPTVPVKTDPGTTKGPPSTGNAALASVLFPMEPHKPWGGLPARSVRLSPTSAFIQDYWTPSADADPNMARFNFEKGGYGFSTGPDAGSGREVRLANQGIFVDNTARDYLALGGSDWWADAKNDPHYSPIDLDAASGSYTYADLPTESKYYDPVTKDWTKTWEEAAQEAADQYAKDIAVYDKKYSEYVDQMSDYTDYLESLGYSTYSDDFGPAELSKMPEGYGLIPKSVDPAL